MVRAQSRCAVLEPCMPPHPTATPKGTWSGSGEADSQQQRAAPHRAAAANRKRGRRRVRLAWRASAEERANLQSCRMPAGGRAGSEQLGGCRGNGRGPPAIPLRVFWPPPQPRLPACRAAGLRGSMTSGTGCRRRGDRWRAHPAKPRGVGPRLTAWGANLLFPRLPWTPANQPLIQGLPPGLRRPQRNPLPSDRPPAEPVRPAATMRQL